MIYITIGTAITLGLTLWFWKYGVFWVAERKATKDLERRLFPNGEEQKNNVLATMEKITNNRYEAARLLDYFLKIKGLQVINMNDPVDFWTRKYLMTPTKMRLNYFEQVKFYETFLNYPEAIGKVIHNPVRETNLQEKVSSPLFKGATLSKKFA
jgi:hypothetical protein